MGWDLLRFVTAKDPDAAPSGGRHRRRRNSGRPEVSTLNRCTSRSTCSDGHDHQCDSDWHNRGGHYSTIKECTHKW